MFIVVQVFPLLFNFNILNEKEQEYEKGNENDDNDEYNGKQICGVCLHIPVKKYLHIKFF